LAVTLNHGIGLAVTNDFIIDAIVENLVFFRSAKYITFGIVRQKSWQHDAALEFTGE